MTYSNIYLETNDIDWFVKIGDRYIHGASGGGEVPNVIIENDIANEKYSEFVETLEPKKNVYINKNLETILNLENKRDDIEFLLKALNIQYEDPIKSYIEKVYVRSFAEYAKRGFWSFDRSLNGNYHLVAWPKSKIKLENDDNIPNLEHIDGRDFQIPRVESFDLVDRINYHFQVRK